MTTKNQWSRATTVLFMTFIMLGIFITSLSAAPGNATHAPYLIMQPLIEATDDPQPIGEPCGSGELLPTDVICLHGTVSIVDPNGTFQLLDAIPVTVTLGDRQVTDRTFIHPGYTTPTFGIDISSLAPDFLKPVTVTVNTGAVLFTRQVVVYPDFNTRNQRFDIQIPAVGALDPAPVWGYVIDFAAGGPVEGAAVTAEHGGLHVAVTTTQLSQASPLYIFNQADLDVIGVTTGDILTLTAQYHNDSDRQIIVLGEAPAQVNLTTGWKCDGFNPLSQTSGGNGMPQSGGDGLSQTSGGSGMPDVGCFWGYGIVDGTPREGVSIRLEISGTVHEARTQYYPGETLPRYGIGLWGGQAISGQLMSVTGVYSGFATTREVTATLGDDLSQEVDLAITSQTKVLDNFTNTSDINALALQDKFLWMGTTGGVVRYNIATGEHTKFTTLDGLLENTIYAVAVDAEGSAWFGSDQGITHYTPGGYPEWESFTEINGKQIQDVRAITIDANNATWFGFSGGIACYTSGENPAWETFNLSTSITSIAVGTESSLWIGSQSGLLHYAPNESPVWETFTTTHGLINNYVKALTSAENGSLWIATDEGVSHYTPGATPQWENFSNNDYSNLDYAYSIAVGEDDTVWVGTIDTLSCYNPNNGSDWQTAVRYPRIRAIAIESEDALWIGTEYGLYYASPGDNPEKEKITCPNEPFNNGIATIAQGADGTFWLGCFGVSCWNIDHYNPISSQWENFKYGDSSTSEIATGTDGSLWFGSRNGLKNYVPNTQQWTIFSSSNSDIAGSWIESIAIGKDGSIWAGIRERNAVGFIEHGITHYTPGGSPEWETFTTTHGLANDYVRSIAVAQDGSLWFGTQEGASHYTPGGTPEWETFTATHGLIFNAIWDIVIAPDGSVWIATAGGVSHYTLDGTPEWENFTPEQGLLDENVISIATGQDGSVWFGTEEGLSHYIPGDQPKWESFTTADGLASKDVLDVMIAEDGSVWVGTTQGLSHLFPATNWNDLRLSLDGPQSVLPGQEITYTLTLVSNVTADAMAILTLTLPANTTYADALPAPAAESPLEWHLDLSSQGSITSTLTITAITSTDLQPGTAFTAMAEAATTSPETSLANNRAQVVTYVRPPDQADVRVSLSGPAFLVPGTQVNLQIRADNTGSLAAENTRVMLSTALTYLKATPTPSSLNPPVWDLGTLSPLSPSIPITVSFTVPPEVPAGVTIAATASITTSTPDGVPQNNTTVITLPTALTDARTLILVAMDRLHTRYGASSLLADLHTLADHPQVRGVIVDILSDPTVQAAYTAWDAMPGSVQRANAVATAIKTLVDSYTLPYPDLRYLVIVGGDEIIPFYRVTDQNATIWHERRYTPQVPAGTIQSALAADQILTDDFYADHTPTFPTSSFWDDRHPMYLPDLALGRLVETPEEIGSVIKTFLSHDGEITLEPGIIGTYKGLTDDLGEAQCRALYADGLTVSCTQSGTVFRNWVLNPFSNSMWTAFHSNHRSLGPVSATDILNRTQYSDLQLLISIGCHAGLSAPADPKAFSDPNLVQTWLSQGGTVIAPTAYAYASIIGIGYTEDLATELTHQLLITSTQEIGPALVKAKQTYYATHSWFDYTDEKVLLPIDLYGLPMLRVITPDTEQTALSESQIADVPVQTTPSTNTSALLYTFSNLTVTQYITDVGTYFAHEDNVIAQDGVPVQPYKEVPLPDILEGRTAHGVLLHSATYTDISPFDPLIAQSWVIGTPAIPLNAEPSAVLRGWDRALPHSLGQFKGITTTVSSLNLILGLYNGDTGTERLFSDMTIEVLYSDSSDYSSPNILSAIARIGSIHASLWDEHAVTQVNAICDDGVGQWQSITLEKVGNTNWAGRIPVTAVRCYIQAVDKAGNVGNGNWITPSKGYTQYLPLITKDESGE